MKVKTGVLLINLGTPDSPKTSDVRRYLRQFLSDARVIDIHPIARFLLVNLIIAPFRSPKSAKEYRKVWTDQGSPLLFHGLALEKLVQEALGDRFEVILGMRYQNPSLESAIKQFKDKGLERIIIFPLFPQYASATTGSVHQEVFRIVSKWQIIPKMVFIDTYAENDKMIQTFAQLGDKCRQKQDYEHFIFSYHGLPERQIRKGDVTGRCLTGDCCAQLTVENKLCYRAQCHATSRKLANKMKLQPKDYTVCFQSRLGKDPWIKPYTEDVILELTSRKIKSVLAFSPAFTSDCLETTVEVGQEYKEIFEENGGEHWELVESLNTEPLWVEAVKDIILEHS